MGPRIGIWLAAGLLTLAAVPTGIALARGQGHGTPDSVPPADEEECAKAKGGPGYGLCVAYCEANDCELDPSSPECVVLRNNYARLTNGAPLPCDDETK